MKTQEWKKEYGGCSARSILKCGSPLPLFRRRSVASRQSQSASPLAQSRPWWQLIVTLFCFCLLLSAFQASGQSYSIDWHKIAGGGGTSVAGNYSIRGTIGQPDAGGPMTGGNYSLTGGFWALISLIQTPGAPALYISHSGNTVTIYWQNVSGWHLQQNNDLTMLAGWSDSSGVAITNGTNYLYIISPHGSLFFRLSNGKM